MWKASQKNISILVNFTSLVVICNLVIVRISLLDYIHKILTSLMAKGGGGEERGAPIVFLDLPDVFKLLCLIFLFLLPLFTCVVVVVVVVVVT